MILRVYNRSKKKKYYDKAFKERAVGLLSQGRKVKELSEELNVPKAYLYRWRRESKTYDASVRFQGNGKERLTPEQERIRELERELADAKLQHEILKKAIGIFSHSDRNATNG